MATLAVVGAIATEFTGATVTVTLVVPLLPSLVAVIVADPAATAVMTPADTVATEAALVDHVTTRSVTTVPLASFTVSVGVAVCEMTRAKLGGDSVTLPTGIAVTVTVEDPLFPSAVAVIVAVPPATPVTTPDDDTVAVDALLVPHVIGRFVTTVPFSSFTVAVNVVVCVATTLAVAGATVTVPTGTGVTVTPIVPLLPSLVAVTVDEPIVTPVATPAEDTVTLPLLLAHVTTRPVRTLPAASFKIGLSVVVRPTTTEAVGDPNVTVATGGSVTVSTDDPLFPSLVAVIVAVPAPTAVTVPVCETVATLAALVDHVTTRSVTTVPATFFTSTDSGAVWPTIIADVAGATTTDPTASAGTVIVAVPDFPSLVAVIVVPPGATAVTTPAVETVAIALFAVLHVTVRPVSVLPSASFVVAVSVVV